jgi:AcrR family transcriptional regulator
MKTAPSTVTQEARERLTRERVVRAALKVMDDEGLGAVSMRRVGRELQVEAMSLYNHVRDKEDLLDGITEEVMSEFRIPQDTSDWREAGREAIREWRRLLKAHPQVIQLFAERNKPMASVSSLRPMEFALACLRGIGLSAEEAGEAFHAVGGYIFGFVLMETREMFGGPSSAMTPDELQAAIPSDELPNVAECFPAAGGIDADHQFEFGLDLLLRGLQARLEDAGA